MGRRAGAFLEQDQELQHRKGCKEVVSLLCAGRVVPSERRAALPLGLGHSLVLPCTISGSYSLAESRYLDKPPSVFALTLPLTLFHIFPDIILLILSFTTTYLRFSIRQTIL